MMSVFVVLLAILFALIGVFIVINSSDTKAQISGMIMVTFVTGFLAAGAAIPRHTVTKYEPDPQPTLLKGCYRVWILSDTTHDNSEEENSLAELEEAGRKRGCSVKTTNTDSPPAPQQPPAPPSQDSLPDEGST